MNSLKSTIGTVMLLFSIIFFVSCSDQEKDFTGDALITYPTLTVTGFSPASGRPGAVITIAGTNFGDQIPATHIIFNGKEATEIVSVTDNEIKVKVPVGATSGPLTVTVWTHTIVTTQEFTYVEPAAITALNPNTANIGDNITITGEYFGTDADAVAVYFKGSTDVTGDGIIDPVLATIVSITNTEIVATVPVGTANGPVTVIFDGFQSVTAHVFTVFGTAVEVKLNDIAGATLIGFTGSWGNNPDHYIQKGVDGDPTTFIDAAESTGYIGYDLGAGQAARISRVRYYPRIGNPDRMLQGQIRGSNDPTLTAYDVLYTITSIPSQTDYTEGEFPDTNTAYRYIYYYGANNCNLSEIEFYGFME